MPTNQIAGQRCDGWKRRDFLRLGTVGALGLAQFLRLRAQACGAGVKEPQARRCILVWLDGGPSHLETFDLKPEVPVDVRGPFHPIRTTVPGLDLCELLPGLAGMARHLAVIRSMTSPLGEHGIANQYLLTGYKPSAALQYPSYGSVLSYVRGANGLLPPYVAIPEFRGGAGYLDLAHRPFVTGGDPSKADFQVRDLNLYPGITPGRMDRRRDFLAEFDRAQAGEQSRLLPPDSAFSQAHRLTTSAEAKRAFHLGEESAKTRARYGPRPIGQSCLLARRLVERDVPFVSIHNGGWDTHDSLTLQLRDGYSGAKVGVGLLPSLDLALSALIGDLAERGLLDQTLVVVMGEFGRTPKLNTRGGRDHWPRVFSLLMAGGGVRGGQVIGSSDRVGESPHDHPVTPADLAFSLYTLLGVDPSLELHTADGRPVPVNQGGAMIRGLV
ncbi:MAG: DUF1501 domain-containing protein [Planctomycetota bacterium]|nr:MAG: DUF1501 domain-containing protein [Planctomycetota bacterium]